MSASTPADGSGSIPVRVFRPTSGTVIGWVGVTLAAVAVLVALFDDHTVRSVRFALAAAIFGLLVWCFMLRPRLVIGTVEVELRNPFASWHVPLARVRRAAVRAVTRVWTDQRQYDGVAVGRPVRSLMRARPARQHTVGIPGLGATRFTEDSEETKAPKGQLTPDMTADFVVEQILLSADRARAAAATPPVDAAATPAEPAAEPRRTWAWPELSGLAVLGVALVVSLLV